MLNAKNVRILSVVVPIALFLAAEPEGAVLAQRTRRATTQSAAAPQSRTANFRADGAAPKIPKVLLSKREEQLCKVKVGDAMPELELPKVGGKEAVKLGDIMGKTATVVVFWKGDRRMALEELADLGPDVSEPLEKEGVQAVGIAVKETPKSAAEALTKAGAKFTNLLDADGKAFDQVGSERLPRTYVLDADGKIVWFDIEYSLTTRRELAQTLRTMLAK